MSDVRIESGRLVLDGRPVLARVVEQEVVFSHDIPDPAPPADPRTGEPVVLTDGSTLVYDPDTQTATLTGEGSTTEHEGVRFVEVGFGDGDSLGEELLGVYAGERTLLVLASSGSAHGDDAAKAHEHRHGLGLVPFDHVTHVAVRSGTSQWDDPETWGGEAPGDGSVVLVPPHATVVLDDHTARLDRVRVLGELRLVSDAVLTVHTLFVDPTGTFEIDVPDGEFVDVIFAGEPPTDPMRLGLGAVLHGTTRVRGEERTGRARVVGGLEEGSTELFLDMVPTNWRPGDTVLVPGLSWSDESTDELRLVESVSTHRVRLRDPLAHSHVPPRDDLPVYVAHLDRNVVFRSEDSDLERRGHVMLMHNSRADILWAAFVDLGRTDASRTITDPDGKGNGVENPRGRYGLHFHRTGLEPVEVPHVHGCVVHGSPRWGFVSHDSHVDFVGNVAFDVVGAGFASEIGRELGTWRGNISVRTHGGRGNNDVGGDDQAFGNEGHGYWLQSAGIRMIDNVACGHPAEAIFYNTRDVREADRPGVQTMMPTRLVPREDWYVLATAGAEWTPTLHVPVNEHRGNVVFASRKGLQVRWHHLGGAMPPPLAVLDTFREDVFWGVEHALFFGYSGGAFFDRCVFYGDMSDPVGSGDGKLLDDNIRHKLGDRGRIGFFQNEKPGNFRFHDCEFSGFLVGHLVGRHDTVFRDCRMGNVVDFLSFFGGKTRGEVRHFVGERTEYLPRPLGLDDNRGRRADEVPRLRLWLDYSGQRDDPVDQVTRRQDPERYWLDDLRAFFPRQALFHVPYVRETVPHEFVEKFPGLLGLTNLELFEKLGWIVGGEPAPADAEEHPLYRALVVPEEPPEVK